MLMKPSKFSVEVFIDYMKKKFDRHQAVHDFSQWYPLLVNE